MAGSGLGCAPRPHTRGRPRERHRSRGRWAARAWRVSVPRLFSSRAPRPVRLPAEGRACTAPAPPAPVRTGRPARPLLRGFSSCARACSGGQARLFGTGDAHPLYSPLNPPFEWAVLAVGARRTLCSHKARHDERRHAEGVLPA